MNDLDFYFKRDNRTNVYLEQDWLGDQLVSIVISSQASATGSGQVLITSLVNQLCRLCRNVEFIFEDSAAKFVRYLPYINSNFVPDGIINLCNEVDPHGDFKLSNKPNSDNVFSLGQTEYNGNYYIGVNNSLAVITKNKHELGAFHDNTLISAALASTLGTSLIFRSILKLNVRETSICSITYQEKSNSTNNFKIIKPNLGNSLVIGAGAVGSCFAYWLKVFGFNGHLTFLDGDIIKLHNTNRSLIFFPNQSLEYFGNKVNKVESVKSLLKSSCTVIPSHYDDALQVKDIQFDSIICLANEDDIRIKVMSRLPLIALQATTGKNWLSQFHRHYYGQDDCTRCRTGEIKPVKLTCSKGQFKDPVTKNNNDAALPFLSATSGLMLYNYFLRRETFVEKDYKYNDESIYFDFRKDITKRRIRHCKSDCQFSGHEKQVFSYQRNNPFYDVGSV